jgi:hypothetical protein
MIARGWRAAARVWRTAGSGRAGAIRPSGAGGLAALVASALIAGAACKRGDVVADLVSGTGSVEGERKQAWSPVSAGARFYAGEAVRTGPLSSARLGFTGGRALRMAEKSLVRFAVGPVAKTVSIGVELGQADIEEGAGEFFVDTILGRARLEAGTHMRIMSDGKAARYEVLVGKAMFEGAVGEVAAGDGILAGGGTRFDRYKISVGAAQVEPSPPPAEAAAAPAAPEPPAPPPPPEPPEAVAEAPVRAPPAAAAAGREAEELEVEPEPRAADVAVPAGESATIHDRHAPVLVRLTWEKTCDRGALELVAGSRKRRRAVQGTSSVLTLAPGSYRYQLACSGAETLTGSLAVRRDPGTAPVPKRPPVNLIDADGRRYTVLYQNRLPALTFAWPKAPVGASFALHIESGGRSRDLPIKASRHVLPSGAVGEGEHQFWFTTSDGATSSPRTSLAVRFDNAAATAQLRAPRDGQRWGDEEIEVVGVALEGSSVSVAGEPLPVDAQGRFQGAVPRPGGPVRSLAVRLAHPRSGVHYYIRRGSAR